MPTSLLTLKDVMERLKFGRSTIYKLIDQGELHPFKVSGSLRFDEEDVEAYIQRCRVMGKPEEGGS